MSIEISSPLRPLSASPAVVPAVAPAWGRHAPRRAADQPTLEVIWARHQDEVEAAQALRHAVFVGEMGARLQVPVGTPAGRDVDVFDAYCEHLLVRLGAGHEDEGQVIGTYRVLTPTAARRIGGLYSEAEFDLTRLAALRPGLAELGRSCVHPAWRQGGVILALWSALADFLQRHRLQGLVGCASMSMRDGGHEAANLWRVLRQEHLAPIEHQVRARLPLPVEALDDGRPAQAPALLKGYLRCGAKVLGAPAWDPDFNTADFPLLLRLEELSARYRRHFLGN